MPSISRRWPTSRQATSRPGRSGASRWRGSASRERPVWLLDEPTVSLDTASVALLVKAIAQHVAGGGLAVIATHVPMALERVREIRLGVAAAAETPR